MSRQESSADTTDRFGEAKKFLLEAKTDADAFSRFIDLTAPYVRGIARRRLTAFHHHDIDDVCQDVFKNIFTALESFDAALPLQPWLVTIARRVISEKIHDLMHHQAMSLDAAKDGYGDTAFSLHDAIPGSSSTGVGNTVLGETIEKVKASVSALPEELRTVVLLRFFEGKKYSEIAKCIGCKTEKVKHKLRLAYQTLSASLSDDRAHDVA